MQKFFHTKHNLGVGSLRGFTLIELLTVLAIIGLLSSIAFAAFSEARTRARDSKRLQEMKQVVTAIELYKSQNAGAAPAQGGAMYGCDTSTCLATLTDELVSNFMPAIPMDPRYGNVGNFGYRYSRCTNTSQFSILYYSEKKAATAGQTTGWCNVQHGANSNDTSCWMTAGVPNYGWCHDWL